MKPRNNNNKNPSSRNPKYNNNNNSWHYSNYNSPPSSPPTSPPPMFPPYGGYGGTPPYPLYPPVPIPMQPQRCHYHADKKIEKLENNMASCINKISVVHDMMSNLMDEIRTEDYEDKLINNLNNLLEESDHFETYVVDYLYHLLPNQKVNNISFFYVENEDMKITLTNPEMIMELLQSWKSPLYLHNFNYKVVFRCTDLIGVLVPVDKNPFTNDNIEQIISLELIPRYLSKSIISETNKIIYDLFKNKYPNHSIPNIADFKKNQIDLSEFNDKNNNSHNNSNTIVDNNLSMKITKLLSDKINELTSNDESITIELDEEDDTIEVTENPDLKESVKESVENSLKELENNDDNLEIEIVMDSDETVADFYWNLVIAEYKKVLNQQIKQRFITIEIS